MKNLNYLRNRKIAPQASKEKTTRTLLQTLLLCLLLGIGTGLGVFGWRVYAILAQTPELNANLIFASGSTQIFDRNGELVFEGGIQRRDWVHFNEISPVMIDALLAIEDSRFFVHYGVDWSRTVVAVMYTARNIVAGSDSMQGGSTLTQQLIKMTHLTEEGEEAEQTIERKLQEISLAIQLERKFSKEQIMEAYLNFAPFGGRIFGIQAASEFYFGVNASELTLSQAATLAGIVQLPNVHNPEQNAQQTQIRRDEVLYLMVRHGFITQEISDLVAAEPITDLLVYQEAISFYEEENYQVFIDHVLNEAFERFGINAMDGYQIYTTLDPEAQRFVNEVMTTNNHIHWPNGGMQSGVAFVGNDGRIRALGERAESRENFVERGFNNATHLRRQPGSTSKPIWAYGPAF